MGLLQRYERQATLLDRPGVITDIDVRRDMQLIARQPVENWKGVQRRVDESGEPTALAGGFAGLEVAPPGDALTALTFNATEACPWTVATYTPIAINRQTPTHYKLFLSGTMTTTATASPTATLTPRIGTTNAGATLGASASIVLTASQTAVPFKVRGEVTVRRTGSGTNGAAFGTFHLMGKLAAPANGIIDANHIYGYTAATFDSQTAATGLWMGWSSAVTTSTVTVQQIIWMSTN